MRCSSHKIIIEKGRPIYLRRNQRVCSMYNLNDIEDEFIFILRCPAHNDLVLNHLHSNNYKSLSLVACLKYENLVIILSIVVEGEVYICEFFFFLNPPLY